MDAEAQGITALSEAAAAGKAEVVQMLLERKASGLYCLFFLGGVLALCGLGMLLEFQSGYRLAIDFTCKGLRRL